MSEGLIRIGGLEPGLAVNEKLNGEWTELEYIQVARTLDSIFDEATRVLEIARALKRSYARGKEAAKDE